MSSYEIPGLFEPVFNSDLTPELHAKFHALFDEVTDLSRTREDDESAAQASDLLHQHVPEEVTAQPILARTICKGPHEWSLLEYVSANADHVHYETIRFLIEANPHALLWAHEYPFRSSKCAAIHLLACCRWSSVLFPWIAERYRWVFEHTLCQVIPPHLQMVNYACQSGSHASIRTFYELYPQGLCEKDDPDADLVIWMSTQYPEAVYHISMDGYTSLHSVCMALTEERDTREQEPTPFKCTSNVARICRFLMSEHPGLILQHTREHGNLPIHILAKRCNRPIVQAIIVLLLKAYPECVHVKADKFHPELSSVPFIQQVHPLVLEELEIDDEISMLAQSSQNMAEAANMTSKRFESERGDSDYSSRFGSLSEVFLSWTKLRVFDVLSPRKQRIQERIADACRFCEGEDIIDVGELNYDSSEIEDTSSNESEEEDDHLNISTHHDER